MFILYSASPQIEVLEDSNAEGLKIFCIKYKGKYAELKRCCYQLDEYL
jgi:hypothetical protein